jgi:hypothetical protein
MLQLGERVYIIEDSLEQNLPVGEYAYIIAYERNTDNVFDYVIRVPKYNRNHYVRTMDVERAEVLIEREVNRIEREALIDFALATRNEELFLKIMKGDETETDSGTETNNKIQSTEEFVKQINLRAWI